MFRLEKLEVYILTGRGLWKWLIDGDVSRGKVDGQATRVLLSIILIDQN